uniref:Adenylate kinase n=1 Tax=Strongyloides stercoralis TaxID=6248 RepID=A0AAF5D1T8_STRER
MVDSYSIYFVQNSTVPVEKPKLDNILKVPCKISGEDKKLVNQEIFEKIESKVIKSIIQSKWNPESVYRQLYNTVQTTNRISGVAFMSNILLPLENNEKSIVKMLKNNENKVNFLISLCGKIMTDVNSKNRSIILDRLWNAFEKHNFQLTINAFNSRIKVWNENDTPFNVKETLHNLEIKSKIMPNEEFMILMLNQIAKSGVHEDVKNFRDECYRRGFSINKEFNLASIRCLSLNKKTHLCDMYIDYFNRKYNNAYFYEALSEAILGFSQQLDFKRLNLFLRKAITKIEKNDVTTFKLNLKQDVIMDVIWNVTVMNTPATDQKIIKLLREIFILTPVDKNFYKLLICESQRHISNGYYFTAAIILEKVLQLSNLLKFKTIDKKVTSTIDWLFNDMIKNRVNVNEIKNIANLISTSINFNCYIFNNLAYSILTFKEYGSFERLSIFLQLINEIDPDRSREHFIFPIIVKENNFFERLKLLNMWKTAGYHDLTKLDIFLLNIYIFNPLFDWLKLNNLEENNYQHLERMVKIFNSYSISRDIVWNWMLNLRNYLSKNDNSQHILREDLTNWLKDTYDETFNKTTIEDKKENEEDFKSRFEKYINNENYKKMDKLIKDSNTYTKINVDGYIDKILPIYLKYGFVEDIMTFLENISNHCSPIEGREEILSSNQILIILQRFAGLIKNMDKIIEVVHDIKKLFPNCNLVQQNYIDTTNNVNQLISKLFTSLPKEKLTENDVDNFQSLITTLCKLDIIELPTNEVITSFFIQNVLKYSSWNVAVKVWSKFQNELLCSNGLLILLNHTLKFSNDLFQLNHIIIKAQKVMRQSRINAFHIASLIYAEQITKVKNKIEKLKKPIELSDVLHVFRIISCLSLNLKSEEWLNTFLKICLIHTNLKSDKNIINLIVNDMLYYSEHKIGERLFLSSFKIVQFYGSELDSKQLKRIQNLEKNKEDLIEKWIFSKEKGLLNIPNSIERSSII